MNEKEKYVKLSDVKKKLNYIYRTYGVSPQMKQTISNALTRIPYAIKGELETVLEAVPVRHGEWLYNDMCLPNCAECSECGWKSSVSGDEISSCHYCPNCGARMDGGKNNDHLE